MSSVVVVSGKFEILQKRQLLLIGYLSMALKNHRSQTNFPCQEGQNELQFWCFLRHITLILNEILF